MVDMFTSVQEKLHDWISRNPPITPLRGTLKLLFTPKSWSHLTLRSSVCFRISSVNVYVLKNRVTTLHQGYGSLSSLGSKTLTIYQL
ncbi:unnamed protein product [Brassica rapa subsp. narinosa]